MTFPTNFDAHVYQTRDGFWKVRLDGLPEGRVVRGDQCTEPSEALEAAVVYLRIRAAPVGAKVKLDRPEMAGRRSASLLSTHGDHPLGCRCRRCE